MNLIELADAGDIAGIVRELGAMTLAQRVACAGALAARAEEMAADRDGYTDEQRAAQRVAELGCQPSPEAAADLLARNPPRFPLNERHPSFDQYPDCDRLTEVIDLYPPDWRAELVVRLADPEPPRDSGYRWHHWFPLAEHIIRGTGGPVPTTDRFVTAWLTTRLDASRGDRPGGTLAERLRMDELLAPTLLSLAVTRPGVPLMTSPGWFASHVEALVTLSAEGVLDRDALVRRIFADLAGTATEKLNLGAASGLLTKLALAPGEYAAVAEDRIVLIERFVKYALSNFMGRHTQEALVFLRALAPTAAENARFTGEHMALLTGQLYNKWTPAAVRYAQQALRGVDEAGLLEAETVAEVSERALGNPTMANLRVAGFLSRLSAGKAINRGSLIETIFARLTVAMPAFQAADAADVLMALALTPAEHEGVAGDRVRFVESVLGSLLAEDSREAISNQLAFLRALAPTAAENARFAREYLALLDRSSIEASAAQEALLGVDEAGLLEADTVTEMCQRILLRPEKKLVRAQLAGLDRAARRDPARAPALVIDAATAFRHQDVALQERALNVVARHLQAAQDAGDAVRPELRAAAGWLSPALAARAAELLGPPDDTAADGAAADGATAGAGDDTAAGAATDTAERFADVLPAVPRPPLVPGPAASAAEVAQEVAAVVAGDQDVAAFERALDGLVRYASVDRAALAKALKPVMRGKPAEDSDCRQADLYDVARAVRGDEPREQAFHVNRFRPGNFSLAGALLAARMSEAMSLIESGRQPFLLAVPSFATGALEAGVLVERLAELEGLGGTPAPVDLAQALLRISPTDDSRTLRAADELHSEAGQRLARWLREGGLPHQDSEPEGWYRPESPSPWAPASPGVTLGPWFPAVATALVGPYQKRNGMLMNPPVPFWVAQLPHHRDEMAARDYTENVVNSGGRRTRVLPFVAEADGPAGYAVHLALARGLSNSPHQDDPTVDALLVLAARGQLDAGMLGRLLEILLRARWAEASRVAGSLRAASETGAYGTVWSVLEAALPGLLRGTPIRGAAMFLSLAAECVSRCGAKGEIAEVVAVAKRGGSSQTVANARLLGDALR